MPCCDVNEYLTQRDGEEMGTIQVAWTYCCINLTELSPDEKRAAYLCDITYTTNSDWFRLCVTTWLPVRRSCAAWFEFALVDETDSILIDEARTPLIISGHQPKRVPNCIFVLTVLQSH